MNKLACFLVLFTFFGLANTQGQEANLSKVTIPSDKEAGSKAIQKWLEARGFECKLNNHTVVYTHLRVVTNLFPIATDGELDRLQVAAFYKAKEEFHNSPELEKLAMTLNKSQNMLRVFIDEDGDLAAVGNITFMDDISAKEFDAYLNLFAAVIKQHILTPEALKLLQ